VTSRLPLAALALTGLLMTAAPAAMASEAAPAVGRAAVTAPAAHAAHPARPARAARCHTGSHLVTRRTRAGVRKLCIHSVQRQTQPQVQGQVHAADRPVALSAFETRLLTLVNAARTSRGLAPVTDTAGTTDVARRWSLQLARAGALSHNPALVDDLAKAGSNSWQFLAENVGTGPAEDPDALFAAYMASPHHRDNILDPRAVVIGMGTVLVPSPDGSVVWNTMDFSDAYDKGYGAARTAPVDSVTSADALPAALRAS